MASKNEKIILRAANQWAISKMTANYTIRDIEEFLRTRGIGMNRNSIATVLMRLKKNGVIEEAHPGRGRRPAIFKRGKL